MNTFDRNKVGYNFVFMFANPPYLQEKNISATQIPFDPIEYKKEYKIIRKSLLKSRKEVNVHKLQGTVFNLR